MDSLNDIRRTFAAMYVQKNFVPDKTGQKTIEILGAQFVADAPTIFGIPNESYIRREIGWYMSRSLNVNDMEPPVPKMWQEVASDEGMVNSNYGFLVYDYGNNSQYYRCLEELRKNQWSRRAIMIYTRPSIWEEYNRHGMSDFICTNTVQYFIRQSPIDQTNRLFAKVDMRSNDAWSGYRNDFAWQAFVFNGLYTALMKNYPGLLRGAIIWNCGSLHLYERNFDLVAHFIETGEYAAHPQDLMKTRNLLVKEGIIRELRQYPYCFCGEEDVPGHKHVEGMCIDSSCWYGSTMNGWPHKIEHCKDGEPK